MCSKTGQITFSKQQTFLNVSSVLGLASNSSRYDSLRRMRTVWFHRQYKRFRGGHLKHSHYYGHVASLPGFTPRITFTGDSPTEALSQERLHLWPPGSAGISADWMPAKQDILFLAGVDWRYAEVCGLQDAPNPKINLIQGFAHADESTLRYGDLAQKAVRICVSAELADAIKATGRVNGPVYTIPNGIEALKPKSRGRWFGAVNRPVTIVGQKEPALAAAVVAGLIGAGVEYLALNEFIARDAFLAQLRESSIVVCLPHVTEGFYLPALEAMALGCLVITLDCIGNRSFCRHDWNCIIAERTAESLVAATHSALLLPVVRREKLRERALLTAGEFTLARERARFHAILGDIDRIWAVV